MIRKSIAASLLATLLLPLVANSQEQATYWIGVNMMPISPQIQHHLADEVKGVMIGEVVPGTPAEDAGIMQFDIIVRANDAVVDTPEVISTAVVESEGKEVNFRILRKGKELNVVVTPAPRPSVDIRAEAGLERQFPRHLIRKWFSGDDVDIEILRDGFLLEEEKLPNNTRIEISRENDGPARIRIEKDGNEWIGTEDDLGKVEDEALRNKLRSMFEKNGPPQFRQFLPQHLKTLKGFNIDEEDVIRLPSEFAPRQMNESLKESLEEMKKQLDELTHRIDELSPEK